MVKKTEQLNIKVHKDTISELDNLIKKFYPTYKNRSHMVEIAINEFLRKRGVKIAAKPNIP